MIQIKELKHQDADMIDHIANLHIKAFPNFFLTRLGKGFIKLLYTCYIKDNDSGIIVATDENRLLGFIAYSNNYSAFYKKIIKKHLPQFAIYSAVAAIKHPSFIKRLLGAFKKSEDVKKTEKYVEIASICVDPDYGKKGIGTKLMNYMKKLVNFDIYKYINLETDAEHNEGVNKFYQKNGFALERTYTTTEGRKMNEYRYRET